MATLTPVKAGKLELQLSKSRLDAPAKRKLLAALSLEAAKQERTEPVHKKLKTDLDYIYDKLDQLDKKSSDDQKLMATVGRTVDRAFQDRFYHRWDKVYHACWKMMIKKAARLVGIAGHKKRGTLNITSLLQRFKIQSLSKRIREGFQRRRAAVAAEEQRKKDEVEYLANKFKEWKADKARSIAADVAPFSTLHGWDYEVKEPTTGEWCPATKACIGAIKVLYSHGGKTWEDVFDLDEIRMTPRNVLSEDELSEDELTGDDSVISDVSDDEEREHDERATAAAPSQKQMAETIEELLKSTKSMSVGDALRKANLHVPDLIAHVHRASFVAAR